MGCPFKNLANISRRGFLKGFSGVAIAAGAGFGAHDLLEHASGRASNPDARAASNVPVPFYDKYQAGIETLQQSSTYFAAFDLVTHNRDDVIALLKKWTDMSAKLTGSRKDELVGGDPARPVTGNADRVDLPVAGLTLTFGFGSSLFSKDGKDRYGLAHKKPAALVDMPVFNGDQIVPEKSDGDISVQACANDPQVAFEAIRQLSRLAGGVAQIRWAQTGFIARPENNETPRNLQGFKDGTINPKGDDIKKYVWVDGEGPSWMQNGTYLVVRKIRMALEHWDNVAVDFQEQVIGRHKYSGAPLGKHNEYDALDLARNDKDGNPVIPENAHVRLAAPETNEGAQILRRGYSYNDGVNFTAERWPPWRQGIEYDAGLLFVAYQRDPRTGFIKIFENMAKFDALNQFVTHTATGLFACPCGVREGEYIGQKLFQNA